MKKIVKFITSPPKVLACPNEFFHEVDSYENPLNENEIEN